MRFQLLSIALATTLCSATAVSAQTRSGPPARGAAAQEHRTELREKLKSATPEERKAAMEKAKERRETAKGNITEAQKAYAASLKAELKATHAAVKAGTLTRETAAAQLKAWREANPRPTRG